MLLYNQVKGSEFPKKENKQVKENRTMMKRFTRTKHVELDVYSECKYTASEEVFENQKVVEYENVIGFEVVTGEQAKEIEARTDGSCIDDMHEYLVLYFENGETSTFRNSYVDMFAW